MLPEQNIVGLAFPFPLLLKLSGFPALRLLCFGGKIIIKQKFFLLMSFAYISAICCPGSPIQAGDGMI